MVDIRSFNIRITSRPSVGPVVQAPGTTIDSSYGMRSPMEAVADVVLTGRAGESGSGWAVGFMQAISFVNWSIYRGLAEADGSILRQLGRLPADKATTCFDAARVGTSFVVPDKFANIALVGGGSLPLVAHLPARPVFPLTVRVVLQDSPISGDRYGIVNKKTGKLNLVEESRHQLDLCAVLALRDPAGRFRLIGGFPWSVGWHTRYALDKAAVKMVATAVPSGTRARVGTVFTGPPTDQRFATVFIGPRTSTCNVEMARVFDEEVAGWPTFAVSR